MTSVPDEAVDIVGGVPNSYGREEAATQTVEAESTFVHQDFETVQYVAPVVIRGTVIEVAGPFWNQKSGQKWEWTRGSFTTPLLYREVTVEVGDLLRDDYVMFDGAKRVTFVALGGDEEGSQDELAGGEYSAGDEVFLFLAIEPFPFRETIVNVLYPYSGIDGVFYVQGGEVTPARDAGSERTASVDAFAVGVERSRETPDPAKNQLLRTIQQAEARLAAQLASIEGADE